MAVIKKNLLLTHVTERMAYKSSAHPVKTRYPQRLDYEAHARNLNEQYERLYSQREVAAIHSKGTYAEFSGVPYFELATKSLENRPSGIRLLNVKESDNCTRATVFIPEGKEEFFRKRIQAYASETTAKGLPKNNDLVGSIENVKLADVESFWTDKPETFPDISPIKCEIWLRYDKNKKKPWQEIEEEFHNICDENHIAVNKNIRLVFPERIVKLITVNRENIETLINTYEYITELRRAEEPASFFTSCSPRDQKLWGVDLLSRCSFSNSGVSVCLLDAGMNGDQPLLHPALLDNGLHAVEDSWGITDNVDSLDRGGHGTEMAGVIVYGDLKEALISETPLQIQHKIESVKILPNRGENDRNLYGAITQQAVSIAETDNPGINRLICMAVTTEDNSSQDGKPTSWSAALDSITSGAEEEDNPHRLFLVSAGNVLPGRLDEIDYPNCNALESVQNPAQAWNAITVGAFADTIEISDSELSGFYALAPKGALSPYSTTSMTWSAWPIKPDVLFAGGNVATNGHDYLQSEDLSTLTTGFRYEQSMFSTICATSAATAQAANFCAKLACEYPELWPETIRALVIHSASWTDEMHRMFCEKGNGTRKTDRRILLRHCGYGIPNLDKAIQCLSNNVNMIIQGELQPYQKKSSSASMNEMHFHTLPWPSDLLTQLADEEVTLRVTLSYFIEPSPGEVGWKNRYRYPSCGLRFDINHTGETLAEFRTRINKLVSEEESTSDLSPNQAGNKWYLGKQRDVGSVHSDFITSTAVELCDVHHIAVYPVGGWWKERTYLEKTEQKVRYALVVSLSTPNEKIDLYTSIVNAIEATTPIPILVGV